MAGNACSTPSCLNKRIKISLFKTRVLDGRGIFAYHEMMIDGKLMHVVAHNQFIQLLYNQGIPGFVMFILMSSAAVLRNIKKRGYISAAMLGVLALSMTLTINPSIKVFRNLLIYGGAFL